MASVDDRAATAIGVAVRQAIAAYQGQPIAGVLLLTDGQSNAGEPPAKAAEFAAAAGVPVVPVAVGTAEGPRFAKVGKMEVSPVVFVRDAVPVRVPIDSRGMAGQPAVVVLEQGDRRRRLGGGRPPADRARREPAACRRLDFTIKQDRPATLQLRARLDDAGPSSIRRRPPGGGRRAGDPPEDPRAVRRRRDVSRSGVHPRDAAARHRHQASTWLQTADADYDQPGDPQAEAACRPRPRS